MIQQVALTVGIPVMSAVAAAAPTPLSGIRLALLVDGAVTPLGALAVFRGLREPSGAALPRQATGSRTTTGICRVVLRS